MTTRLPVPAHATGECLLSRRACLRLVGAGIAPALAGIPAWAVPPFVAVSNAAFTHVVFDERFVDARSFGATLGALGFATRAVQGDLAALWYRDLRDRLRQVRAPVVGLTDRTALFCLEELARDVGLRVMARIEHRVDASGHVAHHASGAPAWTEAANRLPGGQGFGQRVAGLMADPERLGRSCAAQKCSGPAAGGAGLQLATWWMA